MSLFAAELQEPKVGISGKGLKDKDAISMKNLFYSSYVVSTEPYPPMPKSLLAKKGRLGFDIADIPADGSEEEMVFLQKKKSVNPLCREGREGNLGWEPVCVSL